eukprot:5452623-Pleurochrysis_carterae.AAC.8
MDKDHPRHRRRVQSQEPTSKTYLRASAAYGSRIARVMAQAACSLSVAKLRREAADARVEDVQGVHLLPTLLRLLGRVVLSSVAVLRGQLAALLFYEML